MPTIVGIMPPAPQQPEALRQFTYGGSINYDEILMNLLKLADKEEEFENQKKA